MPPSPNSDDTESLLFQLGTRIDSLEKIPMSAGVLVAISLASFFTYYDFSNYAYISPMLKESWNVQDSEIALGASLTVLGYVIGAVLITIYADLYGRKTRSCNFSFTLGRRLYPNGVSTRYDPDGHI